MLIEVVIYYWCFLLILLQGIHACYEKSKSCLDGCDECYAKQLYGWSGIIQRQLQRSQYQMQYSRPFQVVFWIALFFCLIGEYYEIHLCKSFFLKETKERGINACLCCIFSLE